jgi:hypothetical protein
MKNVIKYLIIVSFAAGCNVVFSDDECNAEKTAPYSKEEVAQPHCNNKCCEFIIYGLTETCHEMWCFDGDCFWDMTHSYCY